MSRQQWTSGRPSRSRVITNLGVASGEGLPGQGPMDDRGRDPKLLADRPDRHPLITKGADDGERHVCPGSPELLAGLLHARQPRPDPLTDPHSLLLGDPAQHPQKELPCRPAVRVEPGLLHADDEDAAAVKVEDGLKVPEHRAPETVQRPDHDDAKVPGVRVLHHPVVLGPDLGRRRHLFLVDGANLVAACLHESLDLGALVPRELLLRRGADVQGGDGRTGSVHDFWYEPDPGEMNPSVPEIRTITFREYPAGPRTPD